jgi:hypothetical protein
VPQARQWKLLKKRPLLQDGHWNLRISNQHTVRFKKFKLSAGVERQEAKRRSMEVVCLRSLVLEPPLAAGLPTHVAAASGLARAGEWLHVAPDDSLWLATFALDSDQPGRLHRLLSDPDLPADEKERKRLKPDLESLALVPWQGGQALLALGSGSTERRRRGVLQPLFDCGEIDGPARVFDLAPLYAALPFRELTIEGLACADGRLFLGQRGNSAEGRNALIELDQSEALEAIAEGRPWGPELLGPIRDLELGDLQGVRLTLTDLSAFGPGHLLLSASAEDTDNPYDDGQVMGSVLGRYSLSDGKLALVPLQGPWKIEGVEALDDGRILMVTDGDDPHQPAVLLQAGPDAFAGLQV